MHTGSQHPHTLSSLLHTALCFPLKSKLKRGREVKQCGVQTDIHEEITSNDVHLLLLGANSHQHKRGSDTSVFNLLFFFPRVLFYLVRRHILSALLFMYQVLPIYGHTLPY